jgi:glycosyltransferase involved in cell wall biosynthesis
VPGRIAVVVKGYPRLSETFIAQEILGLEARGLDLLIVALRHPTDPAVHELHRRIRAPVLYLPEYLKDEPLRVLRGLARCLGRPAFWSVLGLWLLDLARDPTANRGRRLGQALVLAAELPGDVARLHVHYLHTPGSVGRYAARLLGLPLSYSAHAKDIWTTPAWDKRQKLLAASWTVTCTRENLAHLRALAPAAEIELAHHGLDHARFAPPERRLEPEPPLILCVARAVEKKGLDILLEALARLPADLDWRFRHIGGGAGLDALRARAERLGIADRVHWAGPLPQEAVIEAYRHATLFCLPARIAGDGDRDGLPNVLMEAMAQELPVVSTFLAAIPEVVEDGVSGILVPPEDSCALAAAIERLLRDPALRRAMGTAGAARVRRDFVMDRGLDRIAAKLRQGAAAPATVACASPSTPR